MRTPGEVLDADFLETRCMLVEIAAALDRHDRAGTPHAAPAPGGDARLDKVYASLAILADRASPPDRAERILELFSDPLD